METSKSRDRLSELPDSLIIHIFGFLPMNDVVRTMILSKQWKALWSSSTCLIFDDSNSISSDRFVRFVYRVLMLWKGSKIEEFSVICLFSRHDKSLYSDIDVWVRFAIDKGVERLHVDVELQHPSGSDDEKQRYWSPPQSLYSCSSLDHLRLTGCNLLINGNVDVEWHNLKELCVDGVVHSQHVIGQVLAGSPKLERFELILLENFESLSIKSSSLKYLVLEKFMWRADDIPSLDSELRICAPNLEILKLDGLPYSKCLLMNVSSLSVADLGFHTDDYEVFNGSYYFIEETLAQILPTIKHVEQLKLSACCIMALGAMELKNMLENVKLLKLNNYCFREYEQIVRLLANVPKLEKLVLQPDDDYGRVPVESLEITNLPNSSLYLLQLSRVTVTWTDDDNGSIFPFIEILFKCASNLQKLVFRVRRLPIFSSFLAATKKLRRMPRSSPTAQVNIQNLMYSQSDSVHLSLQ